MEVLEGEKGGGNRRGMEVEIEGENGGVRRGKWRWK